MTNESLEQRARELLAAEYDKDGLHLTARDLLENGAHRQSVSEYAIAAIIAALESTPAQVVDPKLYAARVTLGELSLLEAQTAYGQACASARPVVAEAPPLPTALVGSCPSHAWAAGWKAALSARTAPAEGGSPRDREADRSRFPDADFNAWLDAGITDCGHTVYDAIGNIADAWQGWNAHVVSMMLDSDPIDFDTARPDVDSLTERARSYDLLFERANSVIEAFNRLGRTRSVAEQVSLHRHCESAMVALKEELERGYAAEDHTARPAKAEGDGEPKWIVNDLGELGVEVNGRCFFLYKGDNIVYDGPHDDGTPMLYRMVGKREFGECCHPLAWVIAGKTEDRYRLNLVYTPGLSDGKPEDGDWKPLPTCAARTVSRGESNG